MTVLLDNSSSVSPINLPFEAQIPRQITFAPFQTGTQHQSVSPEEHQQNASSTSAAAIQRAERFRKFLHLPYWLDCPLICYVGLATLLFVVGLTVTIITTGNPALSKKQDEKSGDTGVQIWIIGPTFMCAAILVCIKCGTHLYDRITERQREADRLARAALGHFLTSDSRPSLNGGIGALPPTYNSALNAAIPSSVITEIEKPDDMKDTESLRLVTLNFEPLPPTYDEALEISSDPAVHKVMRIPSDTNMTTTGASSNRWKRSKSLLIVTANGRRDHKYVRAKTL